MKRAGIFMIILLYFTILFGKNICMASENTEKEQADTVEVQIIAAVKFEKVYE